MIYPKYSHDTNGDKLDYTLDFKDFLQSTERIVECTWFAQTYDGDPTPVVAYSDSISDDGKAVTTWVRGGTPSNKKYLLTAHIKTNSTPEARETDRSIQLVVADK